MSRDSLSKCRVFVGTARDRRGGWGGSGETFYNLKTQNGVNSESVLYLPSDRCTTNHEDYGIFPDKLDFCCDGYPGRRCTKAQADKYIELIRSYYTHYGNACAYLDTKRPIEDQNALEQFMYEKDCVQGLLPSVRNIISRCMIPRSPGNNNNNNNIIILPSFVDAVNEPEVTHFGLKSDNRRKVLYPSSVHYGSVQDEHSGAEIVCAYPPRTKNDGASASVSMLEPVLHRYEVFDLSSRWAANDVGYGDSGFVGGILTESSTFEKDLASLIHGFERVLNSEVGPKIRIKTVSLTANEMNDAMKKLGVLLESTAMRKGNVNGANKAKMQLEISKLMSDLAQRVTSSAIRKFEGHTKRSMKRMQADFAPLGISEKGVMIDAIAKDLDTANFKSETHVMLLVLTEAMYMPKRDHETGMLFVPFLENVILDPEFKLTAKIATELRRAIEQYKSTIGDNGAKIAASLKRNASASHTTLEMYYCLRAWMDPKIRYETGFMSAISDGVLSRNEEHRQQTSRLFGDASAGDDKQRFVGGKTKMGMNAAYSYDYDDDNVYHIGGEEVGEMGEMGEMGEEIEGEGEGGGRVKWREVKDEFVSGKYTSGPDYGGFPHSGFSHGHSNIAYVGHELDNMWVGREGREKKTKTRSKTKTDTATDSKSSSTSKSTSKSKSKIPVRTQNSVNSHNSHGAKDRNVHALRKVIARVVADQDFAINAKRQILTTLMDLGKNARVHPPTTDLDRVHEFTQEEMLGLFVRFFAFAALRDPVREASENPIRYPMPGTADRFNERLAKFMSDQRASQFVDTMYNVMVNEEALRVMKLEPNPGVNTMGPLYSGLKNGHRHGHSALVPKVTIDRNLAKSGRLRIPCWIDGQTSKAYLLYDPIICKGSALLVRLHDTTSTRVVQEVIVWEDTRPHPVSGYTMPMAATFLADSLPMASAISFSSDMRKFIIFGASDKHLFALVYDLDRGSSGSWKARVDMGACAFRGIKDVSGLGGDTTTTTITKIVMLHDHRSMTHGTMEPFKFAFLTKSGVIGMMVASRQVSPTLLVSTLSSEIAGTKFTNIAWLMGQSAVLVKNEEGTRLKMTFNIVNSPSTGTPSDLMLSMEDEYTGEDETVHFPYSNEEEGEEEIDTRVGMGDCMREGNHALLDSVEVTNPLMLTEGVNFSELDSEAARKFLIAVKFNFIHESEPIASGVKWRVVLTLKNMPEESQNGPKLVFDKLPMDVLDGINSASAQLGYHRESYEYLAGSTMLWPTNVKSAGVPTYFMFLPTCVILVDVANAAVLRYGQ